MNQPEPHTPAQPHRHLVDRDEEHLRLLGLYHLIVAGFNALALVLFVLLPLIIGPSYYAALNMPIEGVGTAEMQQRLLGGLLVGGVMTLIFALNGWSLRSHQHRVSSMVLSVVECLSIPVGMILGISAILVLRRESVKALFAQGRPKPAHSA